MGKVFAFFLLLPTTVNNDLNNIQHENTTEQSRTDEGANPAGAILKNLKIYREKCRPAKDGISCNYATAVNGTIIDRRRVFDSQTKYKLRRNFYNIMVAKKTKISLTQARADLQYITLAAKMCKFEIDPQHKTIFVPYAMEEEARNDAVVRLLINEKDCHIELTLDEELRPKEFYNPVLRERIVVEASKKTYIYNPGDNFVIANGGAIVTVKEVVTGAKGGLNFMFEYANRDAPGFKMYESEIKRMLSFKLWKQVTQ